MSTPQPSGDPHPQRPPWAPYPDPLPVWVPVPARLLTPPGNTPAESWWALDGWAVPGPVAGVLGTMGDVARRAIFGPVQRVGLYHFADVGDRIVVQCERLIFVLLPEVAAFGWRLQSVLPPVAAQIRALPSLPPVPGAPLVP